MSLKKSLAWMGAAQLAGFLVQFASSVVLARYLSPRDFGVFGIGLATVALLALIQNFGLQPLIVREQVLTQSIRRTAFTVNAVLAIVQSAATAALAFLGASFLHHEGVKHVLLVLSITPLFGIFSFLPGAELERHARFKETALITFCTNFLGAVATIAFGVMGYSYMSLAYAQVIGAAVLALSFIIVGREYFSCALGLSEWRRVFHFGIHMFAYSGIVIFSQRFCEIMLGRILGLGSLGLYNRASGINNMIWGNVHYLASRIVLVDLSTLQRAGKPITSRYVQTLAMITATLWPAFAGLSVLSGPFITIIYGARWSAAATPLIFLCLASMILVSMTMSWELFAVAGKTAVQTRLEFFRNAVSAPLFVSACFVSLEAAAFTRIVDAGIAFVLYRPHLNAMTKTSLKELWPVYAQSAALTLIAIAPSAALIVLFPDRQLQVPFVAAGILLGIALWFGSLFLIRHPLAEEFVRGWRGLRDKRGEDLGAAAGPAGEGVFQGDC